MALLEEAFDNTLSRDGSAPNGMNASLDMNSNRVINVGSPQSGTDAARWVDVTDMVAVSTPLPSQTGNSGKYVTTDGSTLSFAEAYAKFQRTAREVTASKTPSNYFYPIFPFIDIRRYGAVGDNSTDCTTAITDAVAVADAAGGMVWIPEGTWKTTAAIPLTAKTQIMGAGLYSSIRPVSTHCFTLPFESTFNNTVLANFAIEGTTCTTHAAIYQAGTLDDADELYGVTLDKLLVTDYQTCVDLRNTRVVTITGCWFQDTNRAINLTGKNLVYHITGNEFVYGSGSGAATKIGINLQLFNFTSGSGNIGPEGCKILDNQIYGFDYAVKAGYCFYLNIRDNDIQALVRGIEFETCQYVLNIKDNYIEMQGASATQGIIGLGLSSVLTGQVNIEGNAVDGSGLVTCVAYQVNESGNQNQNYVSLVRNRAKNMPTADIVIYNGGHINIEDNRCESTAPTYSIIADNVVDGIIHIDKNKCTKEISFDPAEAAAGTVRLGTNWINGTTIKFGAQVIPTVASATAMTLPPGADVFLITGSTAITSIPVTGFTGRRVTLISNGGTWTLTDGSNLKLNGNFVATSDDSISLACDGTNWYATPSSAN